MLWKKEKTESTKTSVLPEQDRIKERVGDVSNSNLKNMEMDIEAPSPLLLKRNETTEKKQPIPEPPKPEIPRTTEKPRASGQTAVKKPSPPLFIKIDRYRELLQNISELKSYALNLRDALDALSDIEKELKNGLGVTQAALDKLNSVISAIDSKLLRVGSEEQKDIVEIPEEMDRYVKTLYDNIERIRHELKALQ